MPAAQRRELILESATEVFGERGFAGTTTDRVAQAAGISQPYVVRMFGTKEQLFVEVLQRALERMLDAFEHGLHDGSGDHPEMRMGRAYFDLVTDRGTLLSLMQAFIMGSDPVIGPIARAGFERVYTFLRDDAGMTEEQIQAFLASGMLANTLLALRMADDYEASAIAGSICDMAFGDKVGIIREQRAQDRARLSAGGAGRVPARA
jgi:TetR/AcrR family transcriptional regulator